MKKIYIAFMTVAALAAISCNTKEEYGSLPAGKVMFTAVQADNPESKTILQSDGSVFWSADDSINLFYGTAGSAKLISNNSEPAQQTTFSGSLGGYNHNGSDYFHAVYPYSAENTFDGTAFTVTLPEVQSSVAGSFADDLFISMARSQDYTLQFYNLCGGVKFSVSEAGIKYVTFRGNNNEPLAGKVNVSFNDDGKPVVQTVVDGKTELRLDAPNGGTFEPGEWYYMVSLPATLSAGYTMAFYKDEKFAERVTDSSISIKRAVWGRLTNADGIPDITPPNNEIWYTSTDGNIVTPTDDSGFGANIVSNTYSNGKGIIKFDGDVTEVGNETSKISGSPNPFYNCRTLKTMSLPSSVRKIGYAAFGYCIHLTSLTLPDALDYLGPGIVSKALITSIHIPTSTIIDGNPIYWCEDLEEFTGPYSALDGHILIKDNVLISCTPKGITSVTVPNTVTFIGKSAFIDCSNLTSVSIPSGVTTIGNGAFMRCTGLQTLMLPESVTYAEFNAFTGCSSLTSFHVPSEMEFQGVPFDDCTSLAEFTGRYASDDHRCLVEGSKLIAFAPAGLTSYTVPDGITYMAGGFSNVNNLVSLEIPSTVTQITRIVSSSLTTLTCRSVSPPKVSYAGNTGLAYLRALETIYVPAGSVDAYKVAACWNAYADRIQAIPDNTIPEAVDLGLTSGLKWATCNVGANAPEEYGDYFAWGETEPYYSSQDPLTWKNGKTGYNWASYKWCNGSYSTLTKYNYSSSYGTVDNEYILVPEDDAAAANWGGSWRMPTDAEWTELRTECTWTWTTQNGVNGRLVTGPNGNSIFLPAAGSRGGTGLSYAGSCGFYWSSSLDTDYPDFAFDVFFDSVNVYRYDGYRFGGQSVRPVTE
ncbi:MAG: leucine-rich repeat protein [Bacteroidales bacterium]|nr:leucine-rich repeat protein [Bacteroidales bacterium]